jgi:hypothetical protein
VSSFGDHTAGRKPAASSSHKVFASTLSVLTFDSAIAQLARIGDHHLPDMRLENPRDPKRGPGRLERHLIVGRHSAGTARAPRASSSPAQLVAAPPRL